MTRLVGSRSNRVAPEDPSNTQFNSSGVSPRVLSIFLELCGGRESLRGLTTSEVCQQHLLPLTAAKQESFVEYLRGQEGQSVEEVQTATVFISHAWRFEFLSLIDALLARFNSKNRSGREAYLWIDLFSNNQHLAPDLPFEWWCGTFKSAIEKIHHTVLILEPWHHPIPLTRAWCLWEIFCTVDTQSQLDICMTQENGPKFVKSILNDSGAFFDMLSKIDVRNSDAWNQSDKEKIFEAVKEKVGFEKLNIIVLKHMREWVLRAVKESIREDGNSISDIFEKKLSLASLLRNQGKFDEALTLNNDCLTYATTTFGQDDFNTLKAMNNLAMLYKVMGRHKDALPLYETCLDKRRLVLGNDHEDTLHSMNNLAILYKVLGKFDCAMELFEECLVKRRAQMGETHSSTLASLNNLANLHKSNGSYEKALCLYKECYEKKKDSLGANHPDTLNSMNNLAVGYKAVDQQEDALQLYEKCWAIRKEKLGPGHPDTLVSMNNIARLYQSLERYEEAISLFETCYNIRVETLGISHPSALNSMDNLATCLKLMGKFDRALELFSGCLESRILTLGEHDINSLSSLHNMAQMLATLDRDTDALIMFEKCLQLRTEVEGEQHHHTLTSRLYYAKQLQKLYRFEEAVDLLEKVYDYRLSELGENHVDTLSAMNSLGNCLMEYGQYERSRELLEKCLTLRLTTKGVHHALTRDVRCSFGLTLAAMGQAERGLSLLQEYNQEVNSLQCAQGEAVGKSDVWNEEYTLVTNTAISLIYFIQGKSEESEEMFLQSIKRLVDIKGAKNLQVWNIIRAYNRQTGRNFSLD